MSRHDRDRAEEAQAPDHDHRRHVPFEPKHQVRGQDDIGYVAQYEGSGRDLIRGKGDDQDDFYDRNGTEHLEEELQGPL